MPDMGDRLTDALSKSAETGRPVNVPFGKGVEDKGGKLKRTLVDREKLDGSKLEKTLSDINEAKEKVDVYCGNFKIVEKTLNKETDTWEYKFNWDEKFAIYAANILNLKEGDKLTAEQMDAFCTSILIAQRTDKLAHGVKVEEFEEPNRKKFWKKY